MATVNTEELLAERQKTHGEYSEHARCTQGILRVLQAERGYPALSDMQKETLHMIAHKMGRIVTGNPNLPDHYDDIAGYAKLISQRLENPVEPFDIYTDPLAAVAVGLNMTREEVVASGMRYIPVDGLSDAQRIMKSDLQAQREDHSYDETVYRRKP